MGAPGSQGILSLNIKDKSALYAAYMPYVKNGGLFIPTNKQYSLGDLWLYLDSKADSMDDRLYFTRLTQMKKEFEEKKEQWKEQEKKTSSFPRSSNSVIPVSFRTPS